MSSAKKIGLLAATAIVAGNMMGSGIALLPASLASIGSVSIFGWLVTVIGGISLAYVFARLGTINPQSGGPIAYSGELAPLLGYQAGTLYYHSNWIGNLAIAVTGVSYLAVFFPVLGSGVEASIATIAAVWIFALINLVGADWVSKFVSVGVTLLLIPVVLTGTLGWGWFSAETYAMNWNTTGDKSDFHAFISSVLLCVWSFVGVESASVGAGLVKNPKRTIPLSTLIGTVTAAVVYILSTTAIMGMFEAEQLKNSGAPFAMSAGKIFGSWVEPFVSAFTAFACFASLGSWMMLTAEAGARNADEGYFPKIYGVRSAKGSPAKGIILEATQMSILVIVLMVVQGTEGSSSELFDAIISIAVLTVMLPYFYSCLNLRARTELSKANLIPAVASVVGAVFCMIALYGAKGEGFAETVIVTLTIMIFYVRWESRNKVLTNLHNDS